MLSLTFTKKIRFVNYNHTVEIKETFPDLDKSKISPNYKLLMDIMDNATVIKESPSVGQNGFMRIDITDCKYKAEIWNYINEMNEPSTLATRYMNQATISVSRWNKIWSEIGAILKLSQWEIYIDGTFEGFAVPFSTSVDVQAKSVTYMKPIGDLIITILACKESGDIKSLLEDLKGEKNEKSNLKN